jgi:hypothetical protein
MRAILATRDSISGRYVASSEFCSIVEQDAYTLWIAANRLALGPYNCSMTS